MFGFERGYRWGMRKLQDNTNRELLEIRSPYGDEFLIFGVKGMLSSLFISLMPLRLIVSWRPIESLGFGCDS